MPSTSTLNLLFFRIFLTSRPMLRKIQAMTDSSNHIEFSVLGSGGEIGASCFQVSMNGLSILLDCGTHPKKEGRAALPELGVLGRAPDRLLISHAHQDHCGAVPYLMRQFPMVKAHTTPPTRRIMDRMLHNSVSVMGLIARERGVSDYPLYEHEDVNYAMRSVHGHSYREAFALGGEPVVEGCFFDAGHVLGSASTLLRSEGHTLLYTSDICETNQELMGGHKLFDEAFDVDTLVIESTNGVLPEEKVLKYDDEIGRLGEAMAEVLEGGGTVLVPSFALGRTQEILNIIARLQEEGKVPMVPVFGSGLGRAVYELYDRYIDYLQPDADLRNLDQFGRVGNVWEPSVVSGLLSEPNIIVATSGMMMVNTPSSLIAQKMVLEKHHGIFFVGYLDHETLGYQLLHSKPGDEMQFTLGGKHVPVSLENIKRFSFSAHAPRASLLKLIEHIQPKNVVFVHGDPAAVDWMDSQMNGKYQSFAPDIGQTIQLEA
jgi:Cft2 family RNA processing exonuclease